MLEDCLRGAGATLVALSIFHAVLWRTLHWDEEITRLSPLSARVFAVHTFFIAFVLMGLGLLSLLRPALLLAPNELAKFLLAGIVIFWIARLLMQALVFDRVMREGWTSALWLRGCATLLFTTYVAIYGAAFARQLMK